MNEQPPMHPQDFNEVTHKVCPVCGTVSECGIAVFKLDKTHKMKLYFCECTHCGYRWTVRGAEN